VQTDRRATEMQFFSNCDEVAEVSKFHTVRENIQETQRHGDTEARRNFCLARLCVSVSLCF
jgi:hypothetical protein